eukprot:3196499-Amphidinium_carterae.1
MTQQYTPLETLHHTEGTGSNKHGRAANWACNKQVLTARNAAPAVASQSHRYNASFETLREHMKLAFRMLKHTPRIGSYGAHSQLAMLRGQGLTR